jgi:hypothetical protein
MNNNHLISVLYRTTKYSQLLDLIQHFENHYDGYFNIFFNLSNLIFLLSSRGWIEKFYRGNSLPSVHGKKSDKKNNKSDDDDDDDNDDDNNDDDDLGM